MCAGLLTSVLLPARSRSLGAGSRLWLALLTHGAAVSFLLIGSFGGLPPSGFVEEKGGATLLGDSLDLAAFALLMLAVWRSAKSPSPDDVSGLRALWSATAVVFLAAAQAAGLIRSSGADLLVATKHACALAGVYALYRAYFVTQVVHPYREILATRETISWKLIMAAELRDNETGAHIRRIGRLSEMLGKALGLDAATAEMLRHAAPMHDIGKVGVPDEILRKPGALTSDEWTVMKTHAAEGERILRGSEVAMLEMAADIAGAHHERWDGTGYPRGLRGEEIPESARVVAVVDVYDALSHRRAYKPALAEDEVLRILRNGRGGHFDPRVFDSFVAHLPEARRILAEDPDHPALPADLRETTAGVPARRASPAMAPAVRWTLLLVLTGVGFLAVLRNPATLQPPMPRPDTAAFACPMHPAAASDHPGECPFCGMTLVPRVESTRPIDDDASQPPTKQ